MSVSAKIIDEAGCVTPVWIKDLSVSGFRLETPPHAFIPERFKLHYFLGVTHEVEAEIVWRNGPDLGARRVVDGEALHPSRPGADAQVKKISMEELRRIASRAHS